MDKDELKTSWFFRLNNWANKHEWMFILITFMVFLRIPSLFEPFWYGDENIYLAIGQAMRKGLVLYRDVTDYPNKPPMIYWLAAIVQNVTNFRFLLLLWQIPGVFFFCRLVKKVVDNNTTAYFATLAYVYLTATPLLEGTIANAEIFFIVPTIIGLSLIYPAQNTKTKKQRNRSLPLHFLSGILLGVAFLFKIHVVLDIAFVGLFFYIFPYSLKLKGLISMVINTKAWAFVFGLLVPILVSLVYLGVQGVNPSNLAANAAGSTAYTAAWNTTNWFEQTIGMGSLQSRAVALLLLVSFLYFIKKYLDKNTLFSVLWLVLALFAALLSARPYPHYLIQIVPPLILSISLFFHRKNLWNNLVISFFLVIVVASFYRFDFHLWGVKSYYRNFISYISQTIDQQEYYRNFDRRMPRNYALADSIRQVSGPNDSIYVWGTEPGLYVLADRVQSSPLVVSFHVDDLDYYQETLTSIQEDKPEVIVFMESEWRTFPALEVLIREDYFLVDRVVDPKYPDEEAFAGRVYKRKPFSFR